MSSETKLTEVLTNSNTRIGALENQDYNDNASIAEIKKQLNNFNIRLKITTNVHQYHICSGNLRCSEQLII